MSIQDPKPNWNADLRAEETGCADAESFSDGLPWKQSTRIRVVQRVLACVAVWLPRVHLKRIDREVLRGRGVVDPMPQIDEPGVRTRVFPVIAERRGCGAFAGGRAICCVGAFARDGPRRSGQEPRGARLVVMQVRHRTY